MNYSSSSRNDESSRKIKYFQFKERIRRRKEILGRPTVYFTLKLPFEINYSFKYHLSETPVLRFYLKLQNRLRYLTVLDFS
jgi:hypothetical protein